MQRYHSMRDAYESIYKSKDTNASIQEAVDVLIKAGILDDEALLMLSERLNPFQVTFDKDGKEEDRKKRDSTPAAKKAAKRYAKNADDNRKKGPMAYNPYGKND